MRLFLKHFRSAVVQAAAWVSQCFCPVCVGSEPEIDNRKIDIIICIFQHQILGLQVPIGAQLLISGVI